MKRLFVVLMTLAAGLQSGPALSQAAGSGKSELVEACREFIAQVPEANLGECVSYVIVNENGFPAHACDAFLETEPDLFFEIFDSYSDCLRTLKSE